MVDLSSAPQPPSRKCTATVASGNDSVKHALTYPESFAARPKATPSQTTPMIADHYRVRHDTIDTSGTITIRYQSRLHHIGIGRRYAGQNVLVLVHDLEIRVVTTNGELLRELTLDPTRDYQPQQ